MLPRLPDNVRLYAIGDIHGCLEPLEELMSKICSMEEQLVPVQTIKLVFLGDYVDRGGQSREVVDYLLHELPDDFEPVFLMGNHETMLLEVLHEPEHAISWMRNGGLETIASYMGISPASLPKHLRMTGSHEAMLAHFMASISPEHLQFFQSLELSYRCGDYFFAHAGVNPDKKLDEQDEYDLLWIRERFLRSKKDFEAVIVHGHTPVKELVIKKNRIGIDTGAAYGRSLSAVMLYEDQHEFLSAPVKKADPFMI